MQLQHSTWARRGSQFTDMGGNKAIMPRWNTTVSGAWPYLCSHADTDDAEQQNDVCSSTNYSRKLPAASLMLADREISTCGSK